MPISKKYKAVGAWIFAGGFTVGVSKYFDILAHLEESKYGVKTTELNFPKLPIHTHRTSWPIDQLQEQEPDLVYGNPPCAAWSSAGYCKSRGKDKWKADDRVSCTSRLFELLGALQPKFWIWESVTQAYTLGRRFVEGLTQEANAMGYSVSHVLHDSKWLGIPQSRKRFFMVCHSLKFAPVVPDWNKPFTLPVDVLDKNTESPADWFHTGFLPNVPPGVGIREFWDKMNKKKVYNRNGTCKGRPGYRILRLPLDRPCGAVTGDAAIHPTEHRYISVKEMQTLCGFPPDYQFATTSSGAMHEIARGVCPPVAEWIAKAVYLSLRKAEKEQPVVQLFDLRKPGIDPVVMGRKEYAKICTAVA